jgi:hypothetical protein
VQASIGSRAPNDRFRNLSDAYRDERIGDVRITGVGDARLLLGHERTRPQSGRADDRNARLARARLCSGQLGPTSTGRPMPHHAADAAEPDLAVDGLELWRR